VEERFLFWTTLTWAAKVIAKVNTIFELYVVKHIMYTVRGVPACRVQHSQRKRCILLLVSCGGQRN